MLSKSKGQGMNDAVEIRRKQISTALIM